MEISKLNKEDILKALECCTNEDILKALECCTNSEFEYCLSCPFYGNGFMCRQLLSLAFSFIKELLYDNEHLTIDNEFLKVENELLKFKIEYKK